MPNDAPAGTTAPVLPMLVRLRETGKQDGGEMLKLFDRLSADARYSRFMMPMRELSPTSPWSPTGSAPTIRRCGW